MSLFVLTTEEKMNVVHVNVTDNFRGAGKAAYRLHSAMLDRGVKSSMYVMLQQRRGDPAIRSLSMLKSHIILPIRYKISRFIHRVDYDTSRGLFSTPFSGEDISLVPEINVADVIYLHWVNDGFLSMKSINRIFSLGKPVFWVMHDMWPFTGGCHHSFECDKYKTVGCSACPHLHSSKSKDLSYKILKAKKAIFSKFKNVQIIAPSKWIFNCARQSIAFRDLTVHHIPNLIPTELYNPISQRCARKILGLNESKKTILFAADAGANNPYKGWKYLENALKILATEKVDLSILIIGSYDDLAVREELSYFNLSFLGQLNDEYSLKLLYNAADVFVVPSLADNFPNTVVESLACGTPVVGFSVGGIPDLVEHKINGYLAKYECSVDLARGIKWCLNKKESLCGAARRKIMDTSSPETVLDKHFILHQ